MNRIMVLEDSMINQIAAGEVVERPGSVVKELLENSIDSGATQIVVEIKDGGIGMIRITDNGSGIPEEDVLSAFMRHATSKIRNMDDLENVLTLGFRGEALSSISSVSQLEMVTKPKEQLMAKRVELHGGKLVEDSMIGAADGTTIVMRNLFYNTPARLKFLKKANTEGSHVSEIVNKIILGRPDIAFKYIVNNSEIINTNGSGNLKTAILSVYGRDIAKNLIDVEAEHEGIKVSGYIGKPETFRGNRNYGNIFINGRYIKSRVIEQAVEDAYKTKLMVGKFPVYILNLNLDPTLIDVNVHPQKMEVRFSDESLIYNAFYKAVENALKEHILIPEIAVVKDNPFSEAVYEVDVETPPVKLSDFEQKPIEQKANYSFDMGNVMSSLFKKDGDSSSNDNFISEAVNKEDYEYVVEESIEKTPVIQPAVNAFFNNYRIIGQFFNTYWIVEQDNCIYLIDQHAAHERVIFEKLVNGYKNKELVSQRLLEPVIFNFSDREMEVLKDNKDLFESFGFELEAFGENEFALKSVPFIIRGATDISFFTDLLDRLAENSDSITNIIDEKIDAVASISCKAAVKGNDRLYYIEANNLIKELLKLENPFTCPHGRPTIIKLTRYEIEKMFKRIQ